MIARLRALAFVLAFSAAACGPKPDAIVSIGGDIQLSAAEIDKDPLALLPGNPVGLLKVDATAFFGSSFGPAALRDVQLVAPQVADTGFDPQRDLTSIVAGIYSTSGADVAGIAQGTFDPAKIEAAVERGTVTVQGKPVQKVRYANNTMYVAGDAGFSLLTAKTALFGNMAGMRRALDRIRDGRVKREIPDWEVTLTSTPNAPVVFAADSTNQPVATAVGKQLAFLQGLKTVRLLGNFQAPGLNLAGSLTYPDAASAGVADGQIKQLSSLASLGNMFSFLGGGNPVQSLNSKVQDSDVQVTAAFDGPGLAKIFDAVARR